MRLLARMEGGHGTMASLLYGTGMRLMECIRLRVKDIDFDCRQIVVRDGKGQKHRVVPLPEKVSGPLREHLEKVRVLHREDLAKGAGGVFVPDALERKYPNAARRGLGAGYMSFRVGACPPIRAATSCAAITCKKAACKRPCITRRVRPDWTSR